jgi:hypothetical protein
VDNYKQTSTCIVQKALNLLHLCENPKIKQQNATSELLFLEDNIKIDPQEVEWGRGLN